MKARELDIPHALKHKVPKALLDLHSWRRTMQLSAFTTGILISWIATIQDKDGYAYFMQLLICPWAAALYFIVFPRNPYRGMVWGYSTKLNGLDETDQNARDLVDIYKSFEARRFIFLSTLKISILFFFNAIVLALTHRASFDWQLSFHNFYIGPVTVGYLVGTFIYVGIAYSAWGLEVWARQRITWK